MELENMTFNEERALYASDGVRLENCKFDGPQDGESAFKESRNIQTENCFFNLRYPFWHCENVEIAGCEMTALCRAALWYTNNIKIENTKLHGIKALRECADINMENCSVLSPEFGWFSKNINMTSCDNEGEYFMLKAYGLNFKDVTLKGKYSFQYIEDSVFENCNFDTKDAFWHAKNVTVKNSVIKGEYLAWFCENVSFQNCLIFGTQPFCYCKNLKLINCEMVDCDLSFERSDVEATLTAPILSIKNPYSGSITAPKAYDVIIDDENAKCKLILG